MFGSVRLSAGEPCEVRALARAHLCTSCHAMREFSGRPTALLANWDQSLFAVSLAELSRAPLPQPRRCTAIPWREVDVQPLAPALRRMLAAGNLALIEAKLDDDRQDGAALLPRLARLCLRRGFARSAVALQQLGVPVSLLRELAATQRAAEAAPRPSLRSLAAPSAHLTGQIFGHGAAVCGRADAVAPMCAFGEALGRAVYWFDALLDHRADRRRGRFNALDAVAEGGELFGVAGDAAAGVARELDAASRIAAAQFASPRRAVVLGMLRGLEQRTQRALAALEQQARPRVRSAEAGDCDCFCDAADCGSLCEAGSTDPAATGCCSGSGPGQVCCWGPCDCGPKRRRGRSQPLPDTPASTAPVEPKLHELLGKRGVTVLPVFERGRVRIDGLEYEAEGSGEMIPLGAAVEVVAVVSDGRLRVKRVSEPRE